MLSKLILGMFMITNLGFIALASAFEFADEALKDKKIITKSDHKKKISLKDQRFIIELPAQPGTPFSWRVHTDSKRIFRKLGKTTYRSDADLPGGQQTAIMEFEARGDGKLEMSYVRDDAPEGIAASKESEDYFYVNIELKRQ